MQTNSKALKLGCIAVPSVAIGLSAGAGIPFAAFAGEVPAINLLGFEIVALLAGVMGTLIGLGRFRDGAPLGALCVSGAVAVGALFGWISVQRSFAGVNLTPFVAGRVFAAGIVLLGAVLLVIGFRVGAWLRLFGGLVLALPPLAIAGIAMTGRGDQLMEKIQHIPPAVSLFAGSIGFILASILLAFGVDLIVKTFTVLPADSDSTAAKPSAANAE